MNKVILMGRLTREPDIRYSQGDTAMAIARYTLAVNRGYRKNNEEQQADFVSCVAFQKNAEFAEKYLHQGTKLLVTGRIQTGSYTNRDGQKVYTTEVVINEQEFEESRGTSVRAVSQEKENSGFMDIPEGIEEEGLPFA